MKKPEIPSRFTSIVEVLSEDDAPDRLDWLHPDELAVAQSIDLEQRRNQWILARVAAKTLAMKLGLCDHPHDCVVPSRGVPPELWINGSRSLLHLSISHSHELAAAAIDPEPIGVDIQMRRMIDSRATRFFLRDEERLLIGTGGEDVLLELWGAKEAALKAAGVRLYRDVSLQKITEGDIETFYYRAGSTEGRAETVWLGQRQVVLAVAREKR
ncbi:MAG: 4'-phosphopantetheinyl transferase superfamily protein [Acidobacteria bacterium]|nr:4'-phosphopantetheinyl transferase superfamily protein [Acidobacteriota bacterium]